MLSDGTRPFWKGRDRVSLVRRLQEGARQAIITAGHNSGQTMSYSGT